jgi:hypothetical protein
VNSPRQSSESRRKRSLGDLSTQNADEILILLAGELHMNKKFGPNTINRGAALFECEWDGGVFESGMFCGGLFRAGQFTGGMFIGGIFWGGSWVGGIWEGGFDRAGIYRYRTESPASA